MKVEKVINNNLVRSRDENQQEILVMGCGLGFKKKVDDEIDAEKVEKIYRLDTSKNQHDLEDVLAKIPLKVLQAVNDIIAYGKTSLHAELSDGLVLSLADHISFALKRYEQGLSFPNALLSELRSFYSQEFALGNSALVIIKNYTGIQLPEDEAGFIALHFINAVAQADSLAETYEMMRFIHKILTLVEYDCQIQLDRHSIQCERFVTHLKYFSRRLFIEKEALPDTDPGLHQMIKTQYKKAYLCALKIANLIKVEYEKQLDDDELIYLSIHINRLINLYNKKN